MRKRKSWNEGGHIEDSWRVGDLWGAGNILFFNLGDGYIAFHF